jgi:hypothetical protein
MKKKKKDNTTLSNNFDNCFIIGFILIFAPSFLGFGLLANNTDAYHKTEQIPIDTIVKSSTVLYVELTNGETLEYTSKKDYDEINMNTKIYKVTYFNHYGYENHIKYSLDNF